MLFFAAILIGIKLNPPLILVVAIGIFIIILEMNGNLQLPHNTKASAH